MNKTNNNSTAINYWPTLSNDCLILYIFVCSLNLKLEALEKEVHQLQSLNVEQSELDKIVTVKSGTENKLRTL